jgi:hypothetical protein
MASPAPSLHPVRGYLPGAKPSRPGFYLRYNLPVEELAALLAAHASLPAPRPPPEAPVERRRWVLAALFLGLGIAGCAMDRSLDIDAGVFSSFMPLGWLGAAIALAVGRFPSWPSASAWTGWAKAGCLPLLFCGGPLGFAWLLYTNAPEVSTSPVLGFLGTLGVVLFGFWLGRRKGPPPPPEPPLEKIGSCAEIVAALADDVMPGKPATGWLDFTGPEQRPKLTRQGKAANGAELSLYRDEWWRLRLVLRDGNHLRLAGVVRRKVRGTYWRKGRRRRKQKPSRSQEVASIEARLVVNPKVWRVKAEVDPASSMTGLSLSPLQVRGAAISVVGLPNSSSWFEPRAILAMVALLYRQLERLEPGAST